MIECHEVRLAVCVKEQVCYEDPLRHRLLGSAQVVAREYSADPCGAVLLKPVDDDRVKGFDAELTLVTIEHLGNCFGCLDERSVCLDLNDERDFAVNEP